MDLRVSLLVIGSLIILAIYLYSRRNLQADERRLPASQSKIWSGIFRRLQERLQPRSTPTVHESHAAKAPMLDPDDLEHLEEIIPDRGAGNIKADDVPMIVELTTEQIAPAGEQLFIPLTLMSKAGRTFPGETINHAATTAGLVLKDDGIYRYEVKDAQGYQQPLLGLANILEPGTFDSARLEALATPGLVLYLHLPAPVEARIAFDHLIEIGNKLAGLLEGELCDETRSVLTKQTIGHLREKVEAFRFKQKMTQLQRRNP